MTDEVNGGPPSNGEGVPPAGENPAPEITANQVLAAARATFALAVAETARSAQSFDAVALLIRNARLEIELAALVTFMLSPAGRDAYALAVAERLIDAADALEASTTRVVVAQTIQ